MIAEICLYEFPYSVASQAMPVVLAAKEVEAILAEDLTLRLVRQALTTDDWSELLGTKY